jgi:hypothetical protein
MGEASIFLIFTMLLGGSPGNELLDLIPTDAYWKSKAVEITVPNIMLELNSIKPDDTSKEIAVRRLMAIRTLGELKNADAIATLKPQLDSKEMFVAAYAQRALNAIDGKPAPASSGVPPDRMKADLYMLPEHCGAVAQARFVAGKPLVFPKPKEGDDAAVDTAAQLEQLSNILIYVAEMTGNIRVDGVTIGLSDEVGPNQGFFALFVRGEWDADAVKGAIQSQFNPTRTEGEVEFMMPSFGSMAVAVPSNELLGFLAFPPNVQAPLEEMGVAIKSGKGKLENATDLVKVIESADATQAAWAALLVTDNYRQAPQLAGFDSMTLTARRTDDGMKYDAKATGKDADGVKESVDQLSALVNEGRTDITQEAGRTPAAQPLADFMNSIELKADGTSATGTATMKRPGQ